MRDELTRRLASSPHAVVVPVADLDKARLVIEDLEEHGVPPEAIELIGDIEEREGDDDPAESKAFGELTRSVILGGAAGALAGALLGFIIALAVWGSSFLLAAMLGMIFGAAVGGAAGGMSVAKYNSGAWSQTFVMRQRGEVAVAVHHTDESVVEASVEVMQRQGLAGVERLGRAT